MVRAWLICNSGTMIRAWVGVLVVTRTVISGIGIVVRNRARCRRWGWAVRSSYGLMSRLLCWWLGERGVRHRRVALGSVALSRRCASRSGGGLVWRPGGHSWGTLVLGSLLHSVLNLRDSIWDRFAGPVPLRGLLSHGRRVCWGICRWTVIPIISLHRDSRRRYR